MDGHGIRELLQEVADGRMTVDDAVLKLKQQPFEDLGFAKVDLHRGLRQGVPEVIFGAGKTPEQITSIAERMLQRGETSVLITRMSPEAADIVSQSIDIRYDPVSRIGVAGRITDERVGKITVMTAGTSDIPVAEEAAQTAEALGLKPYYLYRQKNMCGNLENTGFAKVDKAGIYNILMMEEKQSIMAAGAGASTKFVFQNGERIERAENVKDVTNYISRIDEMIQRKKVGIDTWLRKI